MYVIRVFDEQAEPPGFRPVRTLYDYSNPMTRPMWFRSFDHTVPETTYALDEAVGVAVDLAQGGDRVQVVQLKDGGESLVLDTGCRAQLGEAAWVDRFVSLMLLLTPTARPAALADMASMCHRVQPQAWPEVQAHLQVLRLRHARPADSDPS